MTRFYLKKLRASAGYGIIFRFGSFWGGFHFDTKKYPRWFKKLIEEDEKSCVDRVA